MSEQNRQEEAARNDRQRLEQQAVESRQLSERALAEERQRQEIRRMQDEQRRQDSQRQEEQRGQQQESGADQPPGYGHLLGYQPHNRPADDLPERVQLSTGRKDCGAHFLLHMVVHPGGQHRLLDGAHKPRQEEHQQHEPKAPPHRKEN